MMVLFYSSLAIFYQGVSIGGGTGSISDILDASQLICEKVCLLLPILSGKKILDHVYFSLNHFLLFIQLKDGK